MKGRSQGPAAGGRMEAGPAPGAGRLRRLVGSPLQIVLLLASFVLTGYAGARLLADDWFGVAVWFVGAALLHDLVLLPLYSLADRLPRLTGRYVNHLRIPALLSLLLLLVYLPLITGPADRYAKLTGRPEGNNGYALHWLWVTVALFALSGLWAVVRTAPERRARRRRRAQTRRRPAARRRLPRRLPRRLLGRLLGRRRKVAQERRSATKHRPPDSH
ncbi:hypothetical protein [Streptomyces spirodelae]|uniref:hypothetical protein n=1 Tax=Streptomyces spirodelae TaxID=2812904 RepID=UPI0027DC3F89|nr:hypothetical protein [Streptomyces spirodelae]